MEKQGKAQKIHWLESQALNRYMIYLYFAVQRCSGDSRYLEDEVENILEVGNDIAIWQKRNDFAAFGEVHTSSSYSRMLPLTGDVKTGQASGGT